MIELSILNIHKYETYSVIYQAITYKALLVDAIMKMAM